MLKIQEPIDLTTIDGDNPGRYLDSPFTNLVMTRRKQATIEAKASEREDQRDLTTRDGASDSTAGTFCEPDGPYIEGTHSNRVEAAPQLATAPAFTSEGRLLTQTTLNSKFVINSRGVPATAAQTAVQTAQATHYSIRRL